jgi:hypothetical protein
MPVSACDHRMTVARTYTHLDSGDLVHATYTVYDAGHAAGGVELVPARCVWCAGAEQRLAVKVSFCNTITGADATPISLARLLPVPCPGIVGRSMREREMLAPRRIRMSIRTTLGLRVREPIRTRADS